MAIAELLPELQSRSKVDCMNPAVGYEYLLQPTNSSELRLEGLIRVPWGVLSLIHCQVKSVLRSGWATPHSHNSIFIRQLLYLLLDIKTIY